MSRMYEIYTRHANRYDELVRAEDHGGNLATELRAIFDRPGGTVLEAGVGTGRVTRLYIDAVSSAVCCDRSPHMLDFAREALRPHAGKIEFRVAENENLPSFEKKFDLFVEGWSFGHSAMDRSGEDGIRETAARLVRGAAANLGAGGTAVLIETMGTNVDAPAPPDEKLALFYEELEKKHGFASKVIRTDYRFATNEEAADVMGFFFGDEEKARIRARGTAVIPEWTGIWTRVAAGG